jgi:predicted DNA-binding transcriptional regulator AlpA
MITVEQVVAAPTLAATLPREQLVHLYQLVLAAQGVLLPQLLLGAPPAPAEPDVLLDVERAAKRLDVSKDWLYRHPDLPFRVPIGRHVKYSAAGIDRWIRAQASRR